LNVSRKENPIASLTSKLIGSYTFATVAMLSAAFAVMVLVVMRAGVVASGSVDLAHHYALIKEFLDFGGRTVSRPYLGEMNIYPAMSHWTMAHLTAVTGSIIRSISLSLIICTTLIYICFFIMALRNSFGKSLITLSLFSVILYPLEKLHLAAGYEIIGNFFLAQLFAEALFMVLALLIYRLTKPFSVMRTLTICIATWILPYAHLLPGLRLLVVFGVILMLDFYLVVSREKHEAWRKQLPYMALQGFAYGLIGLLLVWRHPAYAAFKQLATNNGGLEFGISLTVIGIALVLFSATVIPFLLWRTIKYREETGTFDRLALAMGIGASLLLLAQLAALLIVKSGSPYAVAKHMFFLFTTDSLLLAIGISRLLDMRPVGKFFRSDPSTAKLEARPELLAAIAILAAVFTVFSFYPAQSIFNMDRFDKLQKLVNCFPADKVVLPMDSSLPGVLNYLVAISDRHLPRNKTSLDLLRDKTDAIVKDASEGKIKIDYMVIDNPIKYKDIFPSLPHVQFVTYAQMPYEIVGQYDMIQRMEVGDIIRFGDNPVALKFLVGGWSNLEPWGVWSDAETSTLIFRVNTHGKALKYALKVTMNPWIAKGRYKQQLAVLVNKAKIAQRELTAPLELILPVHPDADDSVQIDFKIKDPMSPSQLGISSDSRKLGIGLISMELIKI